MLTLSPVFGCFRSAVWQPLTCVRQSDGKLSRSFHGSHHFSAWNESLCWWKMSVIWTGKPSTPTQSPVTRWHFWGHPHWFHVFWPCITTVLGSKNLVDSSGSFMPRLRIFMMVGVGKGMELMAFDSGFGHIFVKLLKHIHVIQEDYSPNPDFSGVEFTNQLPKLRKSPALTMGCSFVRAATAVAFCHLLQDRDLETLSELGMRSPSLGCELYVRSDSIIPSKLLNRSRRHFFAMMFSGIRSSKRPWFHLVSSAFYDPPTLMKHWEFFWTR